MPLFGRFSVIGLVAALVAAVSAAAPVDAASAVGTPTPLVASASVGAADRSAVPVAGAADTGDRPLVVSLTFDDGRANQLRAAAILAAHGQRGTFYINSARFGAAEYMTLAQAQDLAAQGHEIGGHTVSHADLPTLDLDEQRRQICNDRVALLGKGFRVTNFAYPYGDSSAATEQVAADCGYNSARGVGGLVSPGSCANCGYSESLPPAKLYNIATPDSVKSDTTLSDLQGYVRNASAHGNGWVPLVFHDVCTACGTLAVDPVVLDQFSAWLVDQGITVKTVDEVVGGPLRPGVAGPPPTSTASAGTDLVPNPSLETYAGTTPQCWQHGGYGTNTPVWSMVSDAHAGATAQRVDVTGFVDGDVRPISRQDLGTCAPPAVPGHTYVATGWFKTTASVRMVAYYRTASGLWKFLNQSAPLSGSGTDWTSSTLSTGVLPSDAVALSIGYSVRSNGYLVIDDLGLTDADKTPPAVAMTTPGDNSLVRGGVPLGATASDAGGVERVEFLVNGHVVGSTSSAPYQLTWDSTSVPDQVIAVTAKAYDKAGNVALATSRMVTVGNSVPPDTVAPTVSMTSPSAGETVHGTIDLTAAATDNDAVQYVTYRVDGGDVVTAAPGSAASWNTSAVADGAHTLTVLAADRSGNLTVSQPVAVVVDNTSFDTTAPTVSVRCGAGECGTGWYTNAPQLTADGHDVGSGVAAIRYTLDGTDPTASTGEVYDAPVTLSHSATAKFVAVDRAGNVSPVVSVPLLVDTQAPTGVAITAPTEGGDVTGIAPITTTSTDDVGVYRVKFFIDGAYVGSRTKLPLQWNWDTTTVAAGPHTLRVEALDAAGNATSSPEVGVTVRR